MNSICIKHGFFLLLSFMVSTAQANISSKECNNPDNTIRYCRWDNVSITLRLDDKKFYLTAYGKNSGVLSSLEDPERTVVIEDADGVRVMWLNGDEIDLACRVSRSGCP